MKTQAEAAMAGLRVFRSEHDFAAAIEELTRIEPCFREIVNLCGKPKLELRPGGFDALLHIITTQQLSVAAANRIWERLCAQGAENPDALILQDVVALRNCGLSHAKIACVHALLEADLDYDALHRLENEACRRKLTSVKGIGPWSTDIYLLFSLGRSDVFPAGDLAIQEATKQAFSLPHRPGAAELAARAVSWSPWRGAAARLLWRYYRHCKGRDGIAV